MCLGPQWKGVGISNCLRSWVSDRERRERTFWLGTHLLPDAPAVSGASPQSLKLLFLYVI